MATELWLVRHGQAAFGTEDYDRLTELGWQQARWLGAHLAGQILGEAVVLKMGMNALHFSSYGSEKKGSPIRSFLRVAEADQEIRSCAPVERPHLIAVFHDALLRTPGGLAGPAHLPGTAGSW